MAITSLGLLGTGSSKTAGTTLAIVNTTGAVIPAGTLIHIVSAWDTDATGFTQNVTCSTVGGATPTANHTNTQGSGQSGTAGTGVEHQCFRVLTTASIAIGATIATLTHATSVVAKAGHACGWSGVGTSTSIAPVTAVSATGSPSVNGGGNTGNLLIGSVSFENTAQMTGDADTLNGTWSAIVGTFTTGSTAATNVGTGSQFKVLTLGPGLQTYNPTGGVADTVSCTFTLVQLPDPARFMSVLSYYQPAVQRSSNY